MKKLMIFILSLAFSACSPEDDVPTKPVVNDPIDVSMANLLKMGSLMGVGHTASGTASIYEKDGSFSVVLDPFQSQNGPDLKVYLSKDVSASEYLRLGDLKSTNGKQSYSIPSGYNPADYHYVHIWCELYSVEFARAEIK